MNDHSFHLNTFDVKERRLQFFVVIILLVFLPVLMYLLQRALQFGTQAAPDAELSVIPKNMSRTPGNTWELPLNQTVPIDIVLNSGTNRIEAIEATVLYDPTVVSLKGSGTVKTLDNITCNQVSPFKFAWVKKVGGITIDQNGTETGTEIGSATVVCSAVPPVEQWQNNTPVYTPGAIGLTTTVATLTFKTLKLSTNASIAIEYTPQAPKNDSAILSHEGACCSTTDVLSKANNLVYNVTAAQNSATLSLSPSTLTASVNQPFDVRINLSTGGQQVDSADIILKYDKAVLKAQSVTRGSVFDSYELFPLPSGINETGSQGIIQVSGHMSPSTGHGLSGTNLLFATVRFTPLTISAGTRVEFQYTAFGDRNDSNIILYAQSTDILASVSNGTYVVQSGQPTPTRTLTPVPSPTGQQTATHTPIPTGGVGGPAPSATPTRIPTVTLTPTSASKDISMTVVLQGRTWTDAPKNREVKIRFLDTAGVLKAGPIDVVIDATGKIQITSAQLSPLALGAYDILVKPLGYLQQKIRVDLKAGTNTIDRTATPFFGGDLDGSGSINSLDYNILLQQFKTATPLVDLDGSGQVNGLDYSIMLSNWNKTGDSEGVN